MPKRRILPQKGNPMPFEKGSPPGRWALSVMKHWERHHPGLHAHLVESGRLQEVAVDREQAAEKEYDRLLASGKSHGEAEEHVIRTVLLQPPPQSDPGVRRVPDTTIASRPLTRSGNRSSPRSGIAAT